MTYTAETAELPAEYIADTLDAMLVRVCPICGEAALLQRSGEFRMDLPINVSSDAGIIPTADWLHCDACGEDILSKELEGAINQQCWTAKNSRIA